MLWFLGALLLLGMLWLVPAALRAGKGLVPVRRRLRVATLLACVATVPALPVLVLPPTLGRDLVRTYAEDENGNEVQLPEEPRAGRPEIVVVVFAWWLALGVARQMLRLPTRHRHLDRLPPVADPALRARVGELARAQGVAMPRLLQPASIGASMRWSAFASGLLVPVVVVSDGVSHMPPDERDGVLAHELAHLALRHLHVRVAAVLTACLAAVFASGFVPWYVALSWLLALIPFAVSLVGYRQELAADRRAARLVGHAATASGLDKGHAVNLQAEASPWLNAVLTHPSLAVRAAGLAQDAPPAERARIAVDGDRVRRSRRARRIAVTLRALLLLLVLWLGAGPLPGLGAALAVLLLLVPLLPLFAFTRELIDLWQLGQGSWPGRFVRRLLLFAAGVAVMPLSSAVLPEDTPWWLKPAVFGLAVVLVLAWLLGGGCERRARSELRTLLHRRDLHGYLARCARMRPRWRRRPERRLEEALVRAALGERDAALAALAQLADDWPDYCYTAVWTARLLGNTDPAGAVAVARALAAELPGNALARGLLAGCLRRAGGLDEAQALIDGVVRARPRQGVWQASRARIAVARGDRLLAAESLAAAEKLAPGDPSTVLARAEFALQGGDVAGAAAAAAKLRELHGALPLAFLGGELERLDASLAAAGAAGA
jgi:Zn-dependent protease with chaperone function